MTDVDPPDKLSTPESDQTQEDPIVAPDVIEQFFPEEMDNVIPTRGYQMTPMVGIGGSAGGIQALEKFFKAMPSDSGMVFVVILHLSPTHESTMAELLGRLTKMPVLQAQDGQKAEINHVYVIPPAKYLVAVDGHFRLVELQSERGKRVAVDLFFRSLADTHGPHAAAIVISGADGDGAIGIKRIKERGGLTIAQDPDEAEHAGMPRTSIDTGMVDWVLQVGDIPKRLLEYRENEARLKLPPEDGPSPAQPAKPATDDREAALREVLVFLRKRTECDFSYYKRATILRRLARRMQVNNVEDMAAYLKLLRTHPGESGALLQDLLISVTNFFRDREAFEALEQYLPGLFKDKTHNDPVRVWVPACATGEEAYSIAMLLLEHTRDLELPPPIQVFACDLDEDAIRVARAGLYPDAIVADVSEERLRRFFIKDHRGYRVRHELREMVLFAAHDLLKDPPFSRMDLISCRNLLIYLNRDAQKRAFDLFHFALKPQGLLFLGSSEAVEDGTPLYGVLDKKHRIYAHQGQSRIGMPLPIGPGTLARSIDAQERARNIPIVHGKSFASVLWPSSGSTFAVDLDRAALAELHFRLIERLGPPSVIVTSEHDIVHLSESAGSFMQLAGGEPTMNLLRVVNSALRVDLRAALFRATETNGLVEVFDVPAELNGIACAVDIRVSPVTDIAQNFLLVVFQRHAPSAAAGAKAESSQGPAPEPVARHLERELEQVKSSLRDTVEQYEASTEELKASNEELQAMNEELRSATEELETSREELQSINEELTTVNQEMKEKVDELAHANSDLQNLMASTSIATVFLDRDLQIMRYTPSATRIFHLIPGDVGRPLAHLKHKLEYPDLIAEAEHVLATLVPIEREVRANGQWYFARLQPYRTAEDHIAGLVLTFVDVTERKRADEALRQSEERMRILIESAKDFAIFTTDNERRVDTWNSGAQTVFGYSEKEILGQSADVLFTPDDRARGDAEREMSLARDEGHAGNERWHVRKDGSMFYGSGSVMPLLDKNGGFRGFLKIMRDLTETKHTQEALRERMDELTRFNAAAVGRESRMIELKKEINALCSRLGEPPRYGMEAAADGLGEIIQ
ncbi:MAG TPA: chemotaxis protein CheB [Verrucomicrobiae bacterium]|jgi:two-component system CheB/CheR fusion protein